MFSRDIMNFHLRHLNRIRRGVAANPELTRSMIGGKLEKLIGFTIFNMFIGLLIIDVSEKKE